MKKIIDGLKIGIGIFIVMFIGIRITKAALFTANPGDKLTSTKRNDLINKVNSLETTVSTLNAIPAGSVVSFNLSTCPSGRSEYTPAYGRFIRGIDKSGTSIDIDGQRVLGNLQADMLQNHQHRPFNTNGNQQGYEVARSDQSNIYASVVGDGAFTNNTSNTSDPVTGNHGGETRPKNVALLYCVKN